MTTLKELKEELEPYKNTLVLSFCEIVRLDDVVEEKDDFYWVYEEYKKVTYSSCVFGWTPLKGNLPDNIYKKLVSHWNMNHINQVI